jgi:hypothetical protein
MAKPAHPTRPCLSVEALFRALLVQGLGQLVPYRRNTLP